MITIGIDSGTQSTKTIAVDVETGAILATARATYDLIPGLPSGHMEQSPQDWTDAVDATLAECVAALGDRKSEIRAIGVSGQQHGFVPLNAAGRPIRPAKLWCDTSTVAECAEIENKLGGRERVIELAGNPMLPGYTAPKILWLKKNEPAHFAELRTVLLPHDFINFHLTGEKRMEYGDASGTGLMDVRERKWCVPVADAIDASLLRCLPPLGSSLHPCGLLRDALKKELGLTGEIVVSAGGGDNMMGAVGTGNVAPGVVTASLGTSGTLYACADRPMVDEGGEVAAFCDSTDRWMPLVCTMNVTVATEQVRGMFGWDHEQLEKAIGDVAAGSDGLLFLPYLTGERTPSLPNGKALYHGLTLRTMTGPHLARSAMEGVTMGLAYGLERMRGMGLNPTEIRLTGGGSNSAIWRQVAADVFKAETVCLATSEGAALGAALQAAYTRLRTEGDSASFEMVVRRGVALDESTRRAPDPRRAALYAELLELQTGLMRRLSGGGYL